MPMINEAIFAVMEGVGTPEAIDTVMKLGMNHPMGPLTLADFIGLDVCLAIMKVLHDGLGDPEVPRRVRCSSAWSPPASSGGRADAGSTATTVSRSRGHLKRRRVATDSTRSDSSLQDRAGA